MQSDDTLPLSSHVRVGVMESWLVCSDFLSGCWIPCRDRNHGILNHEMQKAPTNLSSIILRPSLQIATCNSARPMSISKLLDFSLEVSGIPKRFLQKLFTLCPLILILLFLVQTHQDI